MAFEGRLGLEAPCPYGVCRQGKLCPHVVQVELATYHSWVLGRSEGAITSMDMITAQDAASQGLVGSGKWRGGGGSPSPVGKERVEESEGRRIQSMFQSIDVTLS